MKHYYAEYSPYGVNTSYQSFGGPGNNGYTFRRFGTRKERWDWLDENEFDRAGNLVADECTRADVERNLGKDFEVDDDGVCFDPRREW